MNTGKKIKLIRTFRGLTQKELGEACGIHEVAIRKYELGKNIPKPEQLRKIAEALNVNVNSLAEPLKAKEVSLAFVSSMLLSAPLTLVLSYSLPVPFI